MALFLRALILSLFWWDIKGQNCQIPTIWTQYPTLSESVKIGDQLLSVYNENTANITSVKLVDLT